MNSYNSLLYIPMSLKSKIARPYKRARHGWQLIWTGGSAQMGGVCASAVLLYRKSARCTSYFFSIRIFSHEWRSGANHSRASRGNKFTKSAWTGVEPTSLFSVHTALHFPVHDEIRQLVIGFSPIPLKRVYHKHLTPLGSTGEVFEINCCKEPRGSVH